eukprot:scaffold6823_cov179-Alexandrium_tamarense.AAC.4
MKPSTSNTADGMTTTTSAPVSNIIASSNKPLKKKKSKAKKKSIPQKGDPDYLTPTQMRNRRKRRAKQLQQLQTHQRSGDDGTDGANPQSSNIKGKNVTARSNNSKDPSMKYITNPSKAPIVSVAKSYFKSIQNNINTHGDFQVHVGPLYGWRTVSKLAVRADTNATTAAKSSRGGGTSASNSIAGEQSSKKKVAIGLFLPQSHILLPVPNCRAHHPSINRVVECVTRACHEVGVVPYQEGGIRSSTGNGDGEEGAVMKGGDEVSTTTASSDKGTGQLRYIGINIERKTDAAQLTLVWNSSPPKNDVTSKKESGTHDVRFDDPMLGKLVKRIISMSNPNGENAEEQPATKRRRRGNRDGTNAGAKREAEHQGGKDDNESNTTIQKETFDLHSIWINYNLSWKHSNTIFAYDVSCWQHVHGAPVIVECLKFGTNENDVGKGLGRPIASPAQLSYEVPLHFPPNVFRQANLDAFTHIVGRIRQRMLQLRKEMKHLPACVELYGGVGTIGLHISDVVASLVSSDENPNNAKCFYDSVKTFPDHIQSRLDYKRKNASDMIATESTLIQKSQVLVVDPPRKGLDSEVVDYLCNTGWKNMKLAVYVSCGFQAFQRDCNALMKSGKWKLEFAEGYLLFPGSDAIETLAFFVPK